MSEAKLSPKQKEVYEQLVGQLGIIEDVVRDDEASMERFDDARDRIIALVMSIIKA